MLVFDFHCSCEVLANGHIWTCDVCSTTADPKGQLETEESDRIAYLSQRREQ